MSLAPDKPESAGKPSLQEPLLVRRGSQEHNGPASVSHGSTSISSSSSGKTLNGATATEECIDGIELSIQSSAPGVADGSGGNRQVSNSRGVHWLDESIAPRTLALNASVSSNSIASDIPDSSEFCVYVCANGILHSNECM